MGNIVVIGSYATDFMVRAPHLPAPGETVSGGPFQMGPGGKGSNQATAAARSGSSVTFVTKIGRDLFGRQAMDHFKREGMHTQFVKMSDTDATGAALITVDDTGENNIVIAPGACGTMTKADVAGSSKAIAKADIVLLQLEISFEAIETAIEQAVIHNVPVLLNPAPSLSFPAEWLQYVTYITPNETEAKELTGIVVKDKQSARNCANVLHKWGVKIVLITLGEKGVFLSKGLSDGEVIQGFKVKAVDTTGAGDAFNGGFAHAVSNGGSLKEAVQFGQAAAALCVMRSGTANAMPPIQAIKTFLNKHI